MLSLLVTSHLFVNVAPLELLHPVFRKYEVFVLKQGELFAAARCRQVVVEADDSPVCFGAMALLAHAQWPRPACHALCPVVSWIGDTCTVVAFFFFVVVGAVIMPTLILLYGHHCWQTDQQ